MERVGTGASGRPRSVGFKRWGRRQPVERSGSEGIGMKAARHKEVVVSSCGEGRQSLKGHHQCSKGNKHRQGTTRQPRPPSPSPSESLLGTRSRQDSSPYTERTLHQAKAPRHREASLSDGLHQEGWETGPRHLGPEGLAKLPGDQASGLISGMTPRLMARSG